MQKEYTTVRMNNKYELTFTRPSIYAGIYDLPLTIKDLWKTVCSELQIDPDSTDYHPNGLDLDASEITSYALHMLTTENVELKNIKRIK